MLEFSPTPPRGLSRTPVAAGQDESLRNSYVAGRDAMGIFPQLSANVLADVQRRVRMLRMSANASATQVADGRSPLTVPAEPLNGNAVCCSTDRCAVMLGALADSNRLQIIRALIAGPLNVSQISLATGLPPQRVSHHLGRMRLLGIVECSRDGRTVVYHVSERIACEAGLDFGCCRIVFR
jgi:ArsR family transcriptional regulator